MLEKNEGSEKLDKRVRLDRFVGTPPDFVLDT
jgi:hypothetical protein